MDAPLVGKPDFEPRIGGIQVRYGRMCGLLMRHLLAAGPYGVREIGSKSKRRARWPFEAYWFFRSRLVDRLPLPCPTSCLHSPVGTSVARVHPPRLPAERFPLSSPRF